MSRSIGGTAMVIALVTLSGTVVATVLASAPTPLPPDPDGFAEDFSAATLDPAWTVVQTFPGGTPRAHGFTSPANEFSLTANPGHLRYSLNHMTHGDGFVNGYQTTFGEHSCCIHDPGLELHRTFGGTDWLLETKVSYHMPFANGRGLDLRVYFGDGGPGTFFARLLRGRDVHPFNAVLLLLQEQTGTTVSSLTVREVTQVDLPGFDGTDTTHFFRLERAGGVLTALFSDDGVTWNTAWVHDFGTALDGLDQRVVVTGLSWFVPAGSYADYDYINVTPTVVPVDIDIKPGSDPNSINPTSRGKIPVAILSSPDFDAPSQIMTPLLRFGATGTEASLSRCNEAGEDVNGDGLADLVCHFDTRIAGFAAGDNEGVLTGQTIDFVSIEGRDSVRIAGS